MIRANGQQIDPALRLFLVQLAMRTDVDEEALTRWMVRHHQQLKALSCFAGSATALDPLVWNQVAVWVREQYMRSLLGGLTP